MDESSKGKWYKVEFKRKAVALGEEIGTTRAARKLGVGPDTLRMWIKRGVREVNMQRKNTPEAKAALEAANEIKKLKRENEELKKANLILRELASVFSKDRPNTDLEWSLNSSKVSNQK